MSCGFIVFPKICIPIDNISGVYIEKKNKRIVICLKYPLPLGDNIITSLTVEEESVPDKNIRKIIDSIVETMNNNKSLRIPLVEI